MTPAQPPSPPRLTEVAVLIVDLLDTVYAFGGIFFLVLAIIVGLQYMTARGDDEQIQQAQQRVVYLLIGFFLFFLSATIVFFIYNFLGVQDCNGNPVVPGFNIAFEQGCN